MNRPRNNQYADKPGAYKVVANLSADIIDPGEFIEVGIYILGYGEIKSPLFIFYPSFSFFDKEQSKVKHGPRKISHTGTTLTMGFGDKEETIPEDGFALNLKGVIMNNWQEPTIFFDDPGSEGRIVTETKQLGDTIIGLKLKTKQNIKPGRYSLKFFLKYYNGETWEVNEEKVYFTVRSLFERHQYFIAWAGLLVALITVWPILWPALNKIVKIYYCLIFWFN